MTTPARHTVTVDGVQYFALPDYQQIAPMVRPEAPARVWNSSSGLVDEAKSAISESNWKVGQMASLWIERFAIGRSEDDLATLIGLSVDQVAQRRRVWQAFNAIRVSYPKLMWSHFWAAIDWEDAKECLKWANDVQAGVSEMRAWRRAQNGEDLIADDPCVAV